MDSGYALRFRVDDALILDLASWVQAERKCCDFLEYSIRVTPAGGPLWLEVTGNAQGKRFIANTLELSAVTTGQRK